MLSSNFNIALVKKDFFDFITNCNQCKSKESQLIINQAFDIAKQAFEGIKKNSGEYYIEHSASVAMVVASEIGLGTTSIVAALLHDVFDETDLQIEELQEKLGGNSKNNAQNDKVNKVVNIILALSKIRRIIDRQGFIQAQAFREVLLTLSDDIRVIFIKIADRLHHLRTLHLYTQRVQEKTVNEALLVYVPLAHRLGLYNVKTELEDLSFKYKQPELYNDISSQIIGSKKVRTQLLSNFSLPIIAELDKNGFDFNITSRTKSVYSIWQKMQRKNISFDEVYDVFAIRIVFNPSSIEKEVEECWHIFKIIESMDNLVIKPDRIRDWLSKPKESGYSALHITVLYKKIHWVEIQIRSKRMDDEAENGCASHWKYKGIKDKESGLDKKIKEIKQKLYSDNSSLQEFFRNLNLNEFSTDVLVFSPDNKVISLPKKASILDFAFAVNPQNALHCIGAKIGKKVVAKNFNELKSGDIIEILSSHDQKPEMEWMQYLVTQKAKDSLQEYFDTNLTLTACSIEKEY